MYGAKITHATSSPYYLYRAFPRPIILISGLALLMYAKNLGPPLTITPSDSENLRPPNPKLPNTRNATSRSGAKTPTGRPASFMPKPESLKLYSAQNCVPFLEKELLHKLYSISVYCAKFCSRKVFCHSVEV